MKKTANLWKSLRLGLAVLAGLVIYAYGFQVTKVDLTEFRKESRQESRLRTLRQFARPDILEYEQEVFVTYTPILVPCPAGGYTPPEPDKSGPYLVFTPPCGNPGETIVVEGFNLQPGTEGPVSFVPSSDPTDTLALLSVRARADDSGHFSIEFKLPERPGESEQYIRATLRRNIGWPHLSQSALETWDKIIETVFLALLATTVGTILSVPISFVAARNLMRDVKSPLVSVALSILGWPLGIWLGLQAANWMGSLSGSISANLGSHIAGAVLSPVVAWAMLRWALNPAESDTPPSLGMQLVRYLALALAALPASLALFQISSLSVKASQALLPRIGGLGFLANFVTQAGDIVLLLSPIIIAVIIGAVLGSVLSRLGQSINELLPVGSLKGANLALAALAGAALFGLIGAGLNWLYEFNDPLKVIYIPAVIGALGGIFVALRSPAKESLPIGLSLYYVTRTVLNAVRSVEALVMAIVAVIWVGIGPFAGTLALALHTVASLAKLYSEQVESIAAGPIEAIQATGANRLQTIMYAVVPQIIPPFISFTMYRWDINVRMSTIIGFAGGGGIGFLLQQNINLVNYRAASTQMVAIAIVVATMDYLSSTLREKYV